MPQTSSADYAPPAALLARLPFSARLLITLGLRLAQQDERRRSRRALALLDESLLRDIGLTPEAREIEVAKPFWRA